MALCAIDTSTINSGSPASFVNTASAVGSAGSGGTVSAVSLPLVTDVVDVTLDQSISPSTVQAGQCVTCTVTLSNNSSVPIRNIRITVPDLVQNLDIRSAAVNGRTVRSSCLCRGISLSALGAGDSAVVTVRAAVPCGVAGTVTSVASADFTFSTSNGATRLTATSNTVVLTVAAPSLEVTKTADRGFVTSGARQITYTLTVRNTGGTSIDDVVVTDVLPEGLTFVAGSTSVNGRGCSALDPANGINVGTLRAGETAVVSFRARAAI